ncbi:hypothetical protein MMC29_005988 [Sticta canariensis]|nr:hypothetical protein [Sticta canariensis]
MASRRPSRRSAAGEPPAYQTAVPKTSLTRYIPEEDSEDNSPPKESRSRKSRPQPRSSRREDDKDDSVELPAKSRRGGKQPATATSSRRDDDDDRRGRYDSDDDDRYGGSRRDHGNRARDQSRSRSRSRNRDRTRTTALVKHGESSKAVSKWDGRSKADARSKGSSRAKHDHFDDEEEEEVIKISRYIAVDIDEVHPGCVEQLCELLDVRASKVKQWCERELIRKDNTTGLLDLKCLISKVDEEDAKKLTRFVKKLADEAKAAKIDGGHNQHPGHSHPHLHQDYIHHHHGHSHHSITHDRPTIFYDPYTGDPIVVNCRTCYELGEFCALHRPKPPGFY